MTRKILILDDDKIRIDWLKKEKPDWDVIWSVDVDSFCDRLDAGEEYDLLVLDHDLGDRSLFGTGSDAVRYLEDDARQGEGDFLHMPVLVWSNNVVENGKMAKILQRAEYRAQHRRFEPSETLLAVIESMVEPLV
jgi:hypothetical protein